MLILNSPAFVEGLALKLGSSPGATDPIQLFPSCDFSDQETDMAMDSLVDADSVIVRSRKPGLLKHQLQLVKRKDIDRYEIAAVPGSLSFEKGFFLFIRACQLLTQNIEGVVLIGLAGPSGAGKTVFSEKVSNFMPNIALISMDDYNDSSRVIDGNYDDPRLTDYDTLLDNLQSLRQGKAVEIPIYDFKSSRRIGYRRLEVPSSRIVIIEGIYALSARLRALLDLRVSVTGGVHFDLVKRVLRDINRSGQEPEDIIHQISETVYPMYKAFIEPDLETAHIKIVNKFNPFSGFQNATYILKSSHTVTEEEIRKVLSPDHTESEEEIYDMYLLPPGEDPETCQSYLRMRNRDGKYSLMFEEWVIDEPFIISPRITFEVSVRLLGGLMALGYEIATILKRISHVFSDDKVTIKVDKLEQLQRKYVQIQGKERSITAETGKRLGLEGYYIPYSYIEQIQLEKLTAEVMALPEDLKAKLSLGENMLQSPTPSFSWIAEARPGVRNLYSKSWTRNATKDIECKQFGRQRSIKQPHLIWSEDNGNHVDEKHHNKRIEHSEDQDHVGLSEQLQSVNERLDELISRLGELESRVSLAAHGNLQRSGSCTIGIAESYGNNECGFHGNANVNGNSNGNKANGHMAYSSADAMLLEEVKLLCRGQHHITAQLDVLSNLLHGNRVSKYAKGKSKGKLQGWFRSMRTGDAGFTSASIFIAALSTATLMVAVKLCQRTKL